MDTPGGPTDPDLGMTAYNAYLATIPGGTTLPPWTALSEAARAAWIAAAVAVKDRLLAPRDAA